MDNYSSKLLYKTKLCKYGLECKRNVCNFAHSNTELHPPSCLFGDKCRNKFEHPWICKFKHPQETLEQYTHRIRVVTVPIYVEIHPKALGIVSKLTN